MLSTVLVSNGLIRVELGFVCSPSVRDLMIKERICKTHRDNDFRQIFKTKDVKIGILEERQNNITNRYAIVTTPNFSDDDLLISIRRLCREYNKIFSSSESDLIKKSVSAFATACQIIHRDYDNQPRFDECSTPTTDNNMREIAHDVDRAIEIFSSCVKPLIDRGENIEHILEKTENITESSEQFKQQAREISKYYEYIIYLLELPMNIAQQTISLITQNRLISLVTAVTASGCFMFYRGGIFSWLWSCFTKRSIEQGSRVVNQIFIEVGKNTAKKMIAPKS